MRYNIPIPGGAEKNYTRFWSKVNITANPDKCWEWNRLKNIGGYGSFYLNGKMFVAHRISYFFHTKIDPANLCVLHKCDNPRCVNPNHLFLGTDADNVKDMIEKGRHNRLRGLNHPSIKNPGYLKRGEQSHQSKLTSEQVVEICESYYKGGITYKELGARYGVHLCQIQRIVKGEAWKHLSAIDKNLVSGIRVGANHYKAKLDTQKVMYIREQDSLHKSKKADLAMELGVSIPVIYDVISRKTWKHI